MNLSQLAAEEKEFLTRLTNLWEISETKQVSRFSFFCNERQILIGEELIRQQSISNCLWFGGYPNALRKVVGFFPFWQPCEEDAFPIQAITLTHPKAFKLSHRDYLGSLMSLGVKRESIGDILPREGGCTLFVLKTVAPVILDELVKVGNIGVQREAGGKDFTPPVREMRPIKGTVASLRMDSLVHLLTGRSREKSADLIRAERVQRNYLTVDSLSQPFEAEDIISIRGYGKYRVDEITGPTKKGRLSVACSQYA